MKTALYYFTGTGNNLALAKDLARELEGEVAMVPIARCVKEDVILPHADAVGIVFPVYVHDVPQIIADFAQKLIPGDYYLFGICTYHMSAFNALFNLNTILEQKGQKLDAGFDVNMPGNSVLIIDNTSSDAENELRFRAAREKTKTIAQTVNQRQKVGIEGRFDPDEKYDSKNYIRYMYKVVEQFWVNDDCRHCGLCTQVCPKGVISLADHKPTWAGECENCLACLHWCPQAAIQNGDNSAKCRRYHHPEIAAAEIINQK